MSTFTLIMILLMTQMFFLVNQLPESRRLNCNTNKDMTIKNDDLHVTTNSGFSPFSTKVICFSFSQPRY